MATMALMLAVAPACSGSNDITVAPRAAAPVAQRDVVAPPDLPSGRLPDTARPLHYALSLSIDPTKERFYGDVTIDLAIPAKTETIVLHGRDLTLAQAEVVLDGEAIQVRTGYRQAMGGKGSPEEIVLTLPRAVAPGQLQLHITYSAALEAGITGLYRVEHGGASYAFTHLEPTEARRVFPCFDEPGHRVPFDLKVTTPKGNVVVASTPEVDRTEPEDGRGATFTFAPTQAIPTYLLGFGVGPFEIVEGARQPVPLRVVTARGAGNLGQAALEATAAHLGFMAEYTAQPFPHPKLDLVAIPEFGFETSVSAGLMALREDLVLLDPAISGAVARKRMAEVVAGAVSRPWFADLVSAAWWDDQWLHDGFSRWMEVKLLDRSRPGLEAREASLREKDRVMGLDAFGEARAVRQPVTSTSEAKEALEPLMGVKASHVLEMVERWIGPELFRDGVRAYLKDHPRGVVTTADLLTSLGEASNRDVSAVVAPFLDRTGVPLVAASLTCESNRAPRVTLTQRRHGARPAEGVTEPPWTFPVCVAYEGGVKAGPACTLLEGTTGEVPLPEGRCPRWIYPNAAEGGYYRFSLPPAQLGALVAKARSLEVSARIGLVANTWALVKSGDVGVEVLLDLLGAMKGERHRLVVGQMIDTLQGVSDLLVDDGVRPGFQAFVSSLLLPLGRELGWEAQRADSDDQRLLRREVLEALLVLAEEPWVFTEAERRAAALLKGPRTLDGNAAAVAVALKASTRRAGEAQFRQLTTVLKKATTTEERRMILEAVGSFADPALLRTALDWTLTGGVTPQDGHTVFMAAAAWPGARPHLLSWMREHLPELKGKLADVAMVRRLGVLSAICDPENRAEAARFFGEALEDLEGAKHPLKQSLAAADLCIAARLREGPRLTKRLGSVSGRRLPR
ncbi:Hypothetical protein CAP_1494 [Chondromyces apiculatus DSM 436]|uniref:Aminopeptidase n=2 Tax=Chondromyces apiculatus TaxID=51 RepID=A0A017TCZ3_9BACT|nr:Hypothetical protein CAP_1494 [Chondromyces apiculatus DSM 436]